MQTMLDLFEATGYKDLDQMTPFVGYVPLKPASIWSFDQKTQKAEFRKINKLFYKGMSEGFEVTVPSTGKSFKCTGRHRFFTEGKWVRAAHLKEAFTGIDEKGLPVAVLLKKTKEKFPVLDVEVEGTKCYFSAGILSHNTFGGGAKVFSNGLKFINPYLSRYDVPLIIINQERASMEKYGSAYSTPGGYAPKYYASWRGRITRIDDILEKGSLVGIVSKVRNTKNKIGIPKREAELQLKFASGFNSEEEYLNFLVPLGLVEQRGAWISNEDWGLKVCGKDNLLPFFKERPELFETVKHSVNSMLAGETNIDRENAAKATEDEEPEGPPPESD